MPSKSRLGDAGSARAALLSLNTPSRSLCPLVVEGADLALHYFACAGVKSGNPIQILAYNDDSLAIESWSLKHSSPGNIWNMSTLVSLPRSVLITKSDANAPRASSTASISVIQYASSDSESSKQVPISISETVSFPKHPAEMTYATFCDADSVVTLDRETLRHWHIDRGSSEPNLSDGFVFGKVPNLRVGKPDPLSAGRFIAASGANVNVFDWRQASPSESALQISSAHPAPIQDLDINPNKPHHLVTAGSDGSIRFWDLRRPDAPILMLLGHTHWVESVAYNHHHDQLVLSGSSDCTVRLWSAQSVSSAPSIGLDTSESPNRVIEIIKDHEDSVYQACWSASDAWVFASLSYDGRVVVNNVNQTEKYKILL